MWAVSPTTGGALQYYQLLLMPSADGLASSGTFLLSFVVNGTSTQVGRMKELVIAGPRLPHPRGLADVNWPCPWPCALLLGVPLRYLVGRVDDCQS